MTVDLSEANCDEWPLRLALLHRKLAPGEHVRFRFAMDDAHGLIADVLEGAGFAQTSRSARDAEVEAVRLRTLADTVAPHMRVLVCGLNPSLYAADAGCGFARPGNRFWPAALAAGLVRRDRDPDDALTSGGVGMTDLVKRATARADALTPEEYLLGLGRVERLCARLAPGAVLFVGLSGWREVRDRRAQSGWQVACLASVPVYLMPSTSGANAHVTLDDCVAHLRRVAQGP